MNDRLWIAVFLLIAVCLLLRSTTRTQSNQGAPPYSEGPQASERDVTATTNHKPGLYGLRAPNGINADADTPYDTSDIPHRATKFGDGFDTIES